MLKQSPVAACRAYPLRGTSAVALAIFAASLLGSAETTVAAPQNGFGLEEIIVIARKRPENLQRVPIAVTALRASDLEARSVENIADAIRFVPNVTFSSGDAAGGSPAQIYIRGVGQDDFSINVDPGVGTYVDGVYLGRATGALLDVMDVDQIEVLRGPQGTLFGRNTIGGAILYTSAKPTGELGGYVQATTGSYSRIDVRASLDFPIVKDRLLAKLSGISLNRDGYQHRLLDGGEQGNQKALAGRGVFLLKASDKIDFTVTVDGTRRREESVPESLIAVSPTPLLNLYNATVGASRGTPLTAAYITGDPFTTNGTGPNLSNLDNWGLSGVFDIDLAPAKLKSISSYRNLIVHFARETDGSPLPYLEVVNNVRQHQFSQELQLTTPLFGDRAELLAGLYYFQERASDHSDAKIASGLYQFVPIDQDRIDDNHVGTDSYAAFSELTINLAKDLRLTAGGRFTHEKKDYSTVAVRPNSGVTFVGPISVSDSWSSFTPKASLDYQAAPSLFLYALYSKGFKSGGFNSRSNQTADVTSYNPEKLDNFEAGFKSDLFDRHLRFNASAFYSNYNDLQVTVIRPEGLIFINTIDNAGKARIKGVEVEAVAEPVKGLIFNGSLGYTDAKYLEVAPTAPFTVNQKLVETPEWTASFGAQYSFPVADIGHVTLRGDYSYRSSVFHDVQNSTNIMQGGYGLLNARASLLTARNALELAVFGANLTNKVYNLFGVNGTSSLGIAAVLPAPPREWGAEVKYHF